MIFDPIFLPWHEEGAVVPPFESGPSSNLGPPYNLGLQGYLFQPPSITYDHLKQL